MDIRIGILQAPREVVIELADGTSIDEVKTSVNAAVAAGDGLVWLTDKNGHQTGFPAAKLAYIEIGGGDEPRIGFG